MRKGLKNLVAVAVALLGVNAMAMAPTISDLPSPIIGDYAGTSGTNEFIFEDAFNLNAFVTDDFTTDGGILWSYDDPSGRYLINGVDPLSGSESPVLPPAGKQIQSNDDPEATTDGNPYTVTLRDQILSPIGGPNLPPTPDVAGIVNPAGSLVTLYASDGTTASGKSTLFYTDNEGIDRFSGGLTPYVSIDFSGTDDIWSYFSSIDGSMSEDTVTPGLCATAILSDVAIEGFRSDPAQPYELVDNTVYAIRTNLSFSGAAGEVPVLQMTLNNTDGTLSAGFGYGGEMFNVDAFNGSNSVPSRGGIYEWWYVPAQVSVSNWRATTGGAFDPANDAVRDFRMEWNIFDVDGVGDLGGSGGGETNAGTICLTNLVIERGSLTALNVGTEVYGITTFDATNANVPGPLSATGTITGGNIVIADVADGGGLAGLALASIEPGATFDATSAASYPIPIVDNQVYMISVDTTAGAGATPLEIIRINADSSFEIIQNTYAAANSNSLGNAALGSAGVTETYRGFFYTHSTTVGAPITNWRPSITIAQRADVAGAADATANLTVNSISVQPIN